MTQSSRFGQYAAAAMVAALAVAVSPIGIRLATGRADLSFRVNAAGILLAAFLLAILGALLTRARLRQVFFGLIVCLFPLALFAGAELAAIAAHLADRVAPLEDTSVLAHRSAWPGYLMSDARWQPGGRLYRPWQGGGITINALGLRTAPPTPKAPGEWRVAVTGGSAVWGWRVADADTITGQLAALIGTTHPHVTIYNFGIEGATIAQELAVLKEFRERYGIDQAVFYTGANNVFATYLETAGANKQRFDAISGLASFELVKAATRFVQTMSEPDPRAVAQLEQTLLTRMRANNPLRAGLLAADEYCRATGLRCDFVLQPLLFTRAHPAGPEVRLVQMFRRLYPGFDVAAHDMYRDALAAMPADRTHDLSHVFDDIADPVLMDNVHLNELGNRIAAQHLARALSLPR